MVNGDTTYLGDAWWWLFKRDGIAQYGILALTSYSDYFINVCNRLLCTMFWDNVWCIIPFILNWVWDASLGKHGKCELLHIVRTTRYSALFFGCRSTCRYLNCLLDTACPFYIGLLHCQELNQNIACCWVMMVISLNGFGFMYINSQNIFLNIILAPLFHVAVELYKIHWAAIFAGHCFHLLQERTVPH